MIIIERTEPWLTEHANQILEQYVNSHKNLHVLEFGSGASTVWFSKQPNIELFVSVEHDEQWSGAVALKQHSSTACLMTLQRPYNNAIDRFGLFDIILIDGRDRVKCIKSSIAHLKPKGILILDNSEREYYNEGIELLKDFKRTDTFQINPDKYGFTYPGWCTSFFERG